MSDGLSPLRDLDQVRGFLSNLGPTALFDLPWMPLYLAICFLFHPLIGWTALLGTGLLVALTVSTELLTRGVAKSMAEHAITRNTLAEAGRRNAEALHALGMGNRIAALWSEANARYLASQQRTADVTSGLGAIAKVLRMVLQSGVLGLGAYLVIHGEATARHHHRELDPDLPRPCPRRAGDRPLEGFRRRPPELEAPARAAARCAGAGKADRAAQAALYALGRGCERRAPWHAEARGPGRHVRLKAGQGAGHHRPERVGQVVAGARSGRACGGRLRGRCGWTGRRSTSGRRRRSAGTLAICRKTSSCSQARLRRTSPASTPNADPEAIIARGQSRPACTN